jgi:hypothetical protein
MPARSQRCAWNGAVAARQPAAYTAAVDETVATLRKARSLLILLLATCNQTLLALEAAANVLDTDLTADLKTMIERTEQELVVLNEKLKALPA